MKILLVSRVFSFLISNQFQTNKYKYKKRSEPLFPSPKPPAPLSPPSIFQIIQSESDSSSPLPRFFQICLMDAVYTDHDRRFSRLSLIDFASEDDLLISSPSCDFHDANSLGPLRPFSFQSRSVSLCCESYFY